MKKDDWIVSSNIKYYTIKSYVPINRRTFEQNWGS